LVAGRAAGSVGDENRERERRTDMKKTTKKAASKASHKKAIKDLDVKPAKGGAVRGGVKVGPKF
jgi:hypothetical protein